ncbi:MAG: outer-membrane lipoprotein carrier protein LolA [Candidatus Poribacteria bacterium]|nr:outer-membrane lipoprotein carrier protein LolA [Candidatus Poribacteria bacterium]
MKRLCWSFTLLCFSLCFVASGYTYTVDKIYANFKTAYEKSKNFSAEFEEITLYKTRKSVAHGRFTFGKPNLLRKEYLDSKDSQKIVKSIVLDGAYAWSYAQVINQVNKQKLDETQRRELLPGIGKSLEGLSENWDMKLVPDEAANSKGVYQIHLTPKDRLMNRTDGNVKEILEIWVKEGEWLPVQFGHVIQYEDGSRRNVIVKLSKIQRDKKLPKNVFKFVIPKGAEVIDLSD